MTGVNVKSTLDLLRGLELARERKVSTAEAEDATGRGGPGKLKVQTAESGGKGNIFIDEVTVKCQVMKS